MSRKIHYHDSSILLEVIFHGERNGQLHYQLGRVSYVSENHKNGFERNAIERLEPGQSSHTAG